MWIYGCTIVFIIGLTRAVEVTTPKQDLSNTEGAGGATGTTSNVNQGNLAPQNQFSPFTYQNTQFDPSILSASHPVIQAAGNDLSNIQLAGSFPTLDQFNAAGFINTPEAVNVFGNTNQFIPNSNFQVIPGKEVRVPEPYPVYIPKPVPVHVPVRVPVEVPKPYPVKVPHPVPVPIHIRVPVPVEKPYPVTITRTVAIPVEKPVYIKVPEIVQQSFPHPYPVTIPKGAEITLPQPGFPQFADLPQLNQLSPSAVQISTPSPSLGNPGFAQEIQIGQKQQTTAIQNGVTGPQQNEGNTAGATESPISGQTEGFGGINPDIFTRFNQINEIPSSSQSTPRLELNGKDQQGGEDSQPSP